MVEDAVTGHKLKIDEQLLNISMATGEGATAVESDAIAHVPPEDLVWTLGAELRAGDRVRHGDRMGFIGWHNDEGALVHVGKAEARLYCGRSLTSGTCGGTLGEGMPCASCVRLLREVDSGTTLNLRLHHVEFDSGVPKRSLHLAHELERASPISGVHVKEWSGATFHSGDAVVVESGVVTHKKSQKSVKLHHMYRPLQLSTLPNARTSTVELVHGNGARRTHGQGGVVISAEPIELERGEATFEVVVKKYAGAGNEGIEVGVTTCAAIRPVRNEALERVTGCEPMPCTERVHWYPSAR